MIPPNSFFFNKSLICQNVISEIATKKKTAVKKGDIKQRVGRGGMYFCIHKRALRQQRIFVLLLQGH